MYKASPEQIAAFRYSLISGIVNRHTPLLPGEIAQYYKEVSSRQYVIPGSTKISVSVRTLERYKQLYEKFGYDGLYPNPRAASAVPQASEILLKIAENLKRERPERSIEQILFLMEKNNLFSEESLSASTISRYFRKIDINGNKLLKDRDSQNGYKRFEATTFNVIWQADFQHTLYLPDPDNPSKRRKAILFIILDDYSRFVVHGQFYWDEKIPRLEDSLKKAILKHGKPEQFYCDNGAAFSSKHLQHICGRIGIRLSHSRPYKPAGRGKCERLFRFVDTSFKPEAYLSIEKGEIQSLEQLNHAFSNWLEGYYHHRIHGSTGVSPYSRMDSSQKTFLNVDLQSFQELFFIEEARTPDKAACIKLLGNEYEVDTSLCGRKISLRYDPFDLSIIQVWHLGKRFSDAKPLELQNPASNPKHYTKKQKGSLEKEHLSPDFTIKDSSGEPLSFFKTAKKQKESRWEQISLSYMTQQKEAKNDA